MITDLDRAVDVLVEMKNVSEVAIGLAYSALLFNDQSLAAEVSHLEDRLDEMRERLELWVLRSAAEQVEPSGLRGLLHLGGAAEELGDAAQQMVWLVEENEEMHPVLAIALGHSDEIIVRVPVSPGSFLDGRTLAEAQLEIETGYYLLAIRRAGRYVYRPRGPVQLQAGDELIAIGPDEGREAAGRARGVPRARRRRHRRDRARPGGVWFLTRPVTAPLTSGETAPPEAQQPTFETPPTGLTAAEVQERVARGAVNDTGERTSRTLGEIVRANVFTRFNAILGAMLAVIVVVGPDPGRHVRPRPVRERGDRHHPGGARQAHARSARSA